MKPIATLIVSILILASCKKNDTPAPELKTYLIKEVRTGATTDFKYDNQNRFAGQIYRDGTNYQETFTIQFNPNGLPAESILRDYVFNRAVKYTYSYNAENKITKIELRDSTNPTTYTLRSTYDFTYAPNRATRTITNASTGSSTRFEYFFDTNGNITKDEAYNSAGTFTSEGSYSAYDDKKNPYGATFEFFTLGLKSTNNFTQQVVRNVVTGATVNYTGTHTYNADGYPTKIVYNNGVTYDYTYEKK
jgi:hypothetical protein